MLVFNSLPSSAEFDTLTALRVSPDSEFTFKGSTVSLFDSRNPDMFLQMNGWRTHISSLAV